MSDKDKKILDRIHAKHYGTKKLSKAAKREAKVTKVIKDKSAIKAINKKLAKVGTGMQFASGTCAPVTPGETNTTGVGIVDQAKTGTRAALMAEAQKKGIKYFRILTKQELVKVLELKVLSEGKQYSEGTSVQIEVIQDAAKARWKAGWGKEKKHG